MFTHTFTFFRPCPHLCVDVIDGHVVDQEVHTVLEVWECERVWERGQIAAALGARAAGVTKGKKGAYVHCPHPV